LIPTELVKRMRDGTAVPLVGAGLSRPSGIASWADLVSRLRKAVEQELGEPIDPADLDLLETPRLFSRVHGSRQPLYDLLEEAVGSKFRPTALHRKLVELPVRTIVTTNWDLLLEDAARDIRPYNVIYEDGRVSTWRESAALQLVKLHGSVTNPTSIVFGEDDYHHFYGGHSLLLQLVKNIIATRSIVALGFGMRDAYVKLLFGQIARLAEDSTNPHYVIIPESARSFQAEYLRSAGFVVVQAATSDADPYGVQGVLEELNDKTSTYANTRHERGRLLIRETEALRTYVGAERIIRIRASLGPLSTPDYSGNPVKQLEMFGDPDLYLLERNLSDLCVTLTKDHGFTIRFIAFPFDESFARDKGYSRQIWADRLVTLQQLAEDLGDRFQIALRRRASDSNTWITGDLGHIESRKGDPAESRGYDRATLDTDGPTIFRAIRWFDSEFSDLIALAGGLEASRRRLLSATA
jgi:hypothetical protein